MRLNATIEDHFGPAAIHWLVGGRFVSRPSRHCDAAQVSRGLAAGGPDRWHGAWYSLHAVRARGDSGRVGTPLAVEANSVGAPGERVAGGAVHHRRENPANGGSAHGRSLS